MPSKGSYGSFDISTYQSQRFLLIMIGVAPIWQVTHVRNKNNYI